MSFGKPRILTNVARFAWATLCCNVAVVLWGAYVRATGSGAGCGNKWPNCGGVVLGASAKLPTIIEFTHRVTSGIALLMIVSLVAWCWRATRKGNWARYSATFAAAFLMNEALLGAGLVLLGHVAQDQSAARVFFLCLHSGNTLLLLASLALTAIWLQDGAGDLTLTGRPRDIAAVVAGLFATAIIVITGTVAALGDTLFPATSLRSSVLEDFTPGAPSLLHYRLLHPVVAVLAGVYVLWVIANRSMKRTHQSRASMALIIVFFIQLGLGFANVLLLAPIWLQIVHLLVADLLWTVLVVASADLVLQPGNVHLHHSDSTALPTPRLAVPAFLQSENSTPGVNIENLPLTQLSKS